MTDRTAHRLKTVAGVMVAMTGVVFGFVLFVRENPLAIGLVQILVMSALYGGSVGGLLALFEFFYVEGPAGRWLRRIPFVLSFLIRGLVYLVGSTAMILLIDALIGWDKVRMPLLHCALLATVMAALVLTGVQVKRLIGPQAFANLLLGRYRVPVREERVVLFLDLVGSTALAERIGDIALHSFLSRFFFDIDEPIQSFSGEVHNYVGDEVIVSWPIDRGLEDACCLRCWFAIRDRIARTGPGYEDEFGTIPEFRTGMHAGPVVVGECGDSKRQIAFLGDTMNTASRIQAECKELGRDLLLSGELVDRLHLPPDWRAAAMGSVQLRGRQEQTELFGIDRPYGVR